MTKQIFIHSLSDHSPPLHFSAYWKAMWYIYQDDWQSAHDIVDGPSGETYAWMHAVVHQMEGDEWNANYWYRRAGKGAESHDVESEKERLLDHLLSHSD